MYTKTFEPASMVLEQAKLLAQATNRNILIHFYADWCHWCHYLEDAFEACAVKMVLQNHYVIVTVVEDGDEGENPGAWEMRRDFGGASSGVPFMAILDREGQKLIDSNDRESRRGNIGCPYKQSEITTFGKMLEATAPNMKEAEREQVLDYFRNAPWRKATIRG